MNLFWGCYGHSFLNMAVITLLITVFSSGCSRTNPNPAGSPEKVTIACATLIDSTLAQVAQMKGYYLEEGLDVTVHRYSFGKLALQEVLAGTADFASVAETPIMLSILDGEKIAVVASIQSSQRNHVIIGRKDAGILLPQDLKGKKIAVTVGTTADFFMDGYLAAHGVSRKEITVVNLKPEEMQNALIKGDIAAVSTFTPFSQQIKNNLGNNCIPFYDKDIYTSTFNMVATQEYTSKYPGRVKKMLQALAKAETFVRNNPLEAQKIVAKFSGIQPSLVADIWDNSSFDLELNQTLILVLEDESRWAIRGGLTCAATIPNYLNYIYFDGLKTVKPDAVRILR